MSGYPEVIEVFCAADIEASGRLLGAPVSGSEFWKVAPEGAAGSYSSNAARRVLISKLRGMLPDVEIV